MLDNLPADLIHYIWEFIGDMQLLLRLRGASTHIQFALRKPYRKLVRYRLLLTDPRCLDPRWLMGQLRACNFSTLNDVAMSFVKKNYILRESFQILSSLVKLSTTNMFTVNINQDGLLLFSSQHAAIPHESFGDHVKCIWLPEPKDPDWRVCFIQLLQAAPLVAVIDAHGGLFPTKHLGELPRIVLMLMRDPLNALMARYRVHKKCNLCNKEANMIPCQKKNPGLCQRCFCRYQCEMQRQCGQHH